jgi:rubrerythrin
VELSAFEEVIHFALEREKEAVKFYEDCSNISKRAGMKQAFLEMANEERKHVRLLENFKPGHIEKVVIRNIPNLKVSDYMVDIPFSEDMGYQDLLILAMKKEESAYNLYTSLAATKDDPDLQKLFQMLAQEELKHKNRLEKEYDDAVYGEN